MARIAVNSPDTRRFVRAAGMHLEAASALLLSLRKIPKSSVFHEVIYIVGTAVECVLRAWYLSNENPKDHEKVISEMFKSVIGHDLEKMKKALTDKGLRMPEAQNRELKNIRTHWASEMRYTIRTWEFKETENAWNDAKSICDWLMGD